MHRPRPGAHRRNAVAALALGAAITVPLAVGPLAHAALSEPAPVLTAADRPATLADRSLEDVAAQRAADRSARVAAERAAAEAAEAARVAAEAAALEAERAAAAERAARAAREADPRSVARQLLAERGQGDQFGCLDRLWQKESGWRWNADNPTSSAYGIPQSLPGSKMASAGADWRTNPVTQIRWGLQYIADVYGGPCSAWRHSQAVNWY